MRCKQFDRAVRIMAAACAIGAWPIAPADAADFYAGKTIEFVVGNYVGGGYDIYARTVARHMVRHIPGNPTIIVKNLPGAGSAKAGQYISVIAPRDGTSIGAVTPGAIMDTLLDGRAEKLFDPTKVLYLGTANSGTRICATMATSKTRTFEQARIGRTIIGGVAPGDSTQDYPYLFNHAAGSRFEIVSGYKGTTDIGLAMERGEIDGACGWDWSSVSSQKADWLRDGKLNLLVQVSLDPDPELTRRGVPPIWRFIENPDDRKAVELVVSQQVFMRSYFAPPGTPEDRLETLRTAFDATMTDPQFLADAERLRIAISPLAGAKVQDLVQRLYATPPAIVERARRAIRP